MTVVLITSYFSRSVWQSKGHRPWSRIEPHSEYVTVSPNVEVVLASSETMFWVANTAVDKGTAHTVLEPVNVIIFFSVTNGLDQEAWLEDCRLILEWNLWPLRLGADLHRVLGSNIIYVGTSIRHLVPERPSISDVDSFGSAPMKAKSSIKTYAAFQYPAGFNLFNRRLKLRVCNSEKDCVSVPIGSKDQHGNIGGVDLDPIGSAQDFGESEIRYEH